MAVPSQLDRAIQRHRAQVTALDRKTAGELVRLYGSVHARIRRDAAMLLEQIKREEVTKVSWLHERDRLRNLRRALEAETGQFARVAAGEVQGAAGEAVSLSAKHVQEVVPGAPLPVAALRTIAALTAEGPVRALLEAIAGPVFEQVQGELAHGIATGRNPREVAGRISKASGVGLGRALTISRTEMLRSYREGQRATFQESDTVEGWFWFSALKTNTCLACWAMHGTRHTLNEKLDGHPNCRCTMMPDVGQGHPDTGVELFARLPEGEQRAILGASAWEAYSAGRVALPDFVQRKRSRKWGTTRTRAPLRDALARSQAA